jgi:hypothetical protein
VAGRGLALRVLPGELAVARLDADAPLWAELDTGAPGGLRAVVRTPDELSVVCPDAAVPEGVRAARGWRALVVAGPLDLALTGILARDRCRARGGRRRDLRRRDVRHRLRPRPLGAPGRRRRALRAAGYDVTEG